MATQSPAPVEHTDKPERASVTQFTIVVNGREVTLKQDQISYSEVVGIAFPQSPGPVTIYTVTYRRGPVGQSEGTLVQGQSVKLAEGMIFNVTPTNRS